MTTQNVPVLIRRCVLKSFQVSHLQIILGLPSCRFGGLELIDWVATIFVVVVAVGGGQTRHVEAGGGNGTHLEMNKTNKR